MKNLVKKILTVSTLSLLCSVTVNAQASDLLVANCNLKKIAQHSTDGAFKDVYLEVEFDNCDQTIDFQHRPFRIDVAVNEFVGSATDTALPAFAQLVNSMVKITFHNKDGMIVDINGVNTEGSLFPNQEKLDFANLVFVLEGTINPVTAKLENILNKNGIAKKSYVSTNKKTGEKIDTFFRDFSLTSLDQRAVLRIIQIGKQFSYGKLNPEKYHVYIEINKLSKTDKSLVLDEANSASFIKVLSLKEGMNQLDGVRFALNKGRVEMSIQD